MNKKKCRKNVLCVFWGICFLAIMFIISVSYVQKEIELYNVAVKGFNDYAKKYNSLVAETSVDNIEFPLNIEELKTESSNFEECVSVIFGQNSISKIKTDTKTVNELIGYIKDSIKVVNQITSPSGEWVKQKLLKVEGVMSVQCLDKENDLDGLLNTDGGYIGCVYFTVNEINNDDVAGESVIDKGTDAGGAIEIYKTLEDAEKRCEYLSQFDNTILYSGSYAILGTTVIRTSYLLENWQQFEYTDRITRALTELE